MAQFFVESYGIYTHDLVFDIIIKFNVNKENIKFKITKLLNGIGNIGVFVAYETNITKILPCATKLFDLNFISDDGSYLDKAACFLRKYKDDKPLILLCNLGFKQNGNFALSPTKDETKLENILIKDISLFSVQ